MPPEARATDRALRLPELAAVAAGSGNACRDLGDERTTVAPKGGCETLDVASPEQRLCFPVDARELLSMGSEVLGERGVHHLGWSSTFHVGQELKWSVIG